MSEEKKTHFWNLKVNDLTVIDTVKLKTIVVALAATGTVLSAIVVEKLVKSDTITDQL